jgi:hypothetical protein
MKTSLGIFLLLIFSPTPGINTNSNAATVQSLPFASVL